MANNKFTNALKGVSQKVPPIWVMRQAGRYHSHYQALRKNHSFMELCKNPELAAEVALGPVMDFDFDLAILFSDLLFPLEAVGLGLTYEDSGPKLHRHLSHEVLKDFVSIEKALPQLEFQKVAMQKTRARLPNDKSLIGFVGGAWTLYVYAVEGSHAGSLMKSKSDPTLFNGFRERMIPLLIENIRLQLDGGAEVVMILDTAAGELSPGLFKDWILPDLEKICSHFPGRLGYYSKGTQPAHLRHSFFQDSDLGGFGVDAKWDMTEVLRLPRKGFVQGNFDQTLLFAEPKVFSGFLNSYLQPITKLSPEERAGWICGLGHGVLPKTPEANIRTFVKTVREIFA